MISSYNESGATISSKIYLDYGKASRNANNRSVSKLALICA